MYVCMCKGVSRNTISELMDQNKSKEDIVKSTGATTMCGTCKNEFEKIFQTKIGL